MRLINKLMLCLGVSLLSSWSASAIELTHSEPDNAFIQKEQATGKYRFPPSNQSQLLYKSHQGNFIFNTELVINSGIHEAGILLETNEGKIFLGVQEKSLVWRYKNQQRQLSQVIAGQTWVLQLERRDQQIYLSCALLGKPLESRLLEGNFSDHNKIGLVSTSATQVDFRNTRFAIPAWKGLKPYKDYLGSHLEIFNIETGEREIVYTTKDGIEAPNWTPDGKKLLFNSKGRLYYFDLASREVSELNTDFAIKNNNDHVLSFDGKYLGISHHSAEHNGQSIVYWLDAKGGIPKPLTTKAPSYLHGISPDNRYVIYTAQRNGQFDIYRTTTDGKAEETQLTFTDYLEDGSEYSPDGKYIYFNSTRTGKMKLWRMDENGENQTQLTHDTFNDWFPHVAPDMNKIVFLSYMPDMNPDQHPYYQQVYLRLLPLQGGEPKVIAYLYGGQGTINVPSWSPDSKRLAFVSNSQLDDIKN